MAVVNNKVIAEYETGKKVREAKIQSLDVYKPASKTN
jgi:hypothetical protein